MLMLDLHVYLCTSCVFGVTASILLQGRNYLSIHISSSTVIPSHHMVMIKGFEDSGRIGRMMTKWGGGGGDGIMTFVFDGDVITGD